MRPAQKEEPSLSRRTTLTLLPALIAALAAAAALLLPGNRAEAAANNSVQVLSVEHSIDFGVGINVRMLAESDAPVAEVRAVFTPQGAGRISSYSYPHFTQEGASVEADFTINTGGSAYYPPGTEFEVFFEVTAADGATFSSEPVSILYLDPQHDWQLLSQEDIPLDIYYYGFSRGTAEAMADRVAGSWRDIAETVGIEPERVTRFRAVIYPNITAFSPAAPPLSAAASDGLFFGGFALHRYSVFVLGTPSPDSVVHELTHLLIDSAVTSPLSSTVPSWLHEGLAQFFEAGSSEHYSNQLRSRARSRDLMVMRNRNTVPALGDEIGLFYTQVGSFIGGLVEQHGPGPMATTLRLINRGMEAADALGEAYGKPFWQLENDWRVSLGAQPLPDPSGTPLAQATATPPGTVIGDSGVVVETPGADGGSGFNWIGPAAGAGAAAAVFVVWSVVTNRRRFGGKRR